MEHLASTAKSTLPKRFSTHAEIRGLLFEHGAKEVGNRRRSHFHRTSHSPALRQVVSNPDDETDLIVALTKDTKYHNYVSQANRSRLTKVRSQIAAALCEESVRATGLFDPIGVVGPRLHRPRQTHSHGL
jgi:hypothetical protein